MEILNLKKEYIKTFSDVIEPCIESEMNKLPILSFSIPRNLGKYFKPEFELVLSEGNFLVKEKKRAGQFYEVYAKPNIDSLFRDFKSKWNYENKTLKEMADDFLFTTDWTLVCSDNKRATFSGKNSTAFDMLQEAIKKFEYEFYYDVKRKVIVAGPLVGEDRGAYFHDELNLREISLSTQTYDLCTRVVPFGKNGLTIESVNGGKLYVESKYNPYRKIIYQVWKDERYTIPENLKLAAQKIVDKNSQAYEAYEVDVINLAKLSGKYSYLTYGLGDTITLIDNENKSRVKQRILSKKSYLRDRLKDTVSISALPLTVQNITKNIRDLEEVFEVKFEDVINAMPSADGFNKVWSGNIEPPLDLVKEGDIRFAPDLNKPGETILLIFENGKWIDPLKLDKLKKDLEESQLSIQEAQDKADKAYEEITSKIPGIEEDIKSTASSILGQLNEFKTTTETSITKVQNGITSFDEKLKTKADSTAIVDIKETVDGLQGSIKETNSKVDNLQVGGRNLLTGTSDDWSEWIIPVYNKENSTGNIAPFYYDMLPGDVYTISFELQFDELTDKETDFRIQGAMNGVWEYNPFTFDSYTFKNNGVPKNLEIVRVVKVANIEKTYRKADIGWRVDNWTTGKFRYRRLKIEKGNMATDWTPAPEDMASQENLNEFKKTAEGNFNRISTIENDLSSGNTYKKIQQIKQTATSNKTLLAKVKETADGAVQVTAYNNKISTIDKDISTLMAKTNPNDPTSIAYKLNETVKTVDGNYSKLVKDISAIGQRGTNLIIRNDEEKNKYLLDTGTAEFNGHNLSGYILVEPNFEYIFRKQNSVSSTDNNFRIGEFDAELNMISRVPTTSNTFNIKTSPTTRYIRLSYPADSEPVMIKSDTLTVSEFNEFKQTAEGNFKIIKSIETDLTSGATYKKINEIKETADGVKANLAKTDGIVTSLSTWKKTADSEISRIATLDSDFMALDVGGRNLFKNSANPNWELWYSWDAQKKSITKTDIYMTERKEESTLIGYYSLRDVVNIIPEGSSVSVSFDVKNELVETSYTNFILGAGFKDSNVVKVPGQKLMRVKLKAKVDYSKSDTLQIQVFGAQLTSPIHLSKFDHLKVEFGNVPTDWSPAPEDLMSITSFNEFKRTTDQTLSIIRNNKLTSQINQEAGQVLISAGTSTTKGKLQITDAGAYMEKSFIKEVHIADASITDAKIQSISASKITFGTLDGRKANIVYLNASNITSGILSGGSFYLNLANGYLRNGGLASSNVRMEDGVFKVYNGSSLESTIDSTGMRVYSNGIVNGTIRTTSFVSSAAPTFSIIHSKSYSFSVLYENGSSSDLYVLYDKYNTSGKLTSSTYPIEFREGVLFSKPLRLIGAAELRVATDVGIVGINNSQLSESVFIGALSSKNGILIGSDGIPYIRSNGNLKRIATV